MVALKLFLIGMTFSLPVGIFSFHVINTTLQKGFRSGFFAMTGIIVADIILMAGYYEFPFVNTYFNLYEQWIKAFGGVAFMVVGLNIVFKKRRDIPLKVVDFRYTFKWSLFNPLITFTSGVFISELVGDSFFEHSFWIKFLGILVIGIGYVAGWTVTLAIIWWRGIRFKIEKMSWMCGTIIFMMGCGISIKSILVIIH